MSTVGDTRQWIEAADGSWINPITGGTSEVLPCGWCFKPVLWVVEGDHHTLGRCVDPEAAQRRYLEYSRRTRGGWSRTPYAPLVEKPTTAIVVRWPSGLDHADIRQISRAFGQELSKRHDPAEVTVRTYGTAP